MSLSRYLIPFAIFGAVIGVCAISDFLNEKDLAAEKYAEAMVNSDRDAAAKDILNNVDKAVAKSDAIFDKEAAQSKILVSEWKQNSGYDDSVAAIRRSMNEEIEAVKESFNLSGRKADILNREHREIEAVKASMSYDSKVEELNGKIKSAKEGYSMQKDILKMATNQDETAYDQLKRTAKKVKDDAVFNAKQSLDNLNKRFEEQTKSIKARCEADISKLESDLDKEVSKVKSKYSGQLDTQAKNLSKEVSRINADIIKNRSEEERMIINDAKRMVMEKEDIEAADRISAQEIVAKMSTKDKLAALFTSNGWTPEMFAIVAVLPLIPLTVLVFKYVKDIRYIVKAMNRMKGVLKIA